MSPLPELRQLSRLAGWEPRAVLRQLLELVCDQLAMDLAFVSVINPGGGHVLEIAVGADGTPAAAQGGSEAPGGGWCERVVTSELLLVDDVTEHPDLCALPLTAELDIVSCAGVSLRRDDSSILGSLCAIGHDRHAGLTPRDLGVLLGLGEVVAPLVEALGQAASDPTAAHAPAASDPTAAHAPAASGTSAARAPDTAAPDTAAPAPAVPAVAVPGGQVGPASLAGLADVVSAAHTLEDLTRPLLAALHELTGLASSYLTVRHEDAGLQEVRFAQNSAPDLSVPEGLFVPWEDTLCKRALDEGRPCTTAVPDVWGDSAAAAAMGLQVYVSVPVELPDGRVWGTLCAADASDVATSPEGHLPTMRLFAKLIGAEVGREAAVATARLEADTDALTGCSSRRVIEPWLESNRVARAAGETVVVLYADIDDFKRINDTFGHLAGDAVLIEVGRRLRAVARPADLVARLGGDEFLLAARLPVKATGGLVSRVRKAMTFETGWQGRTVPVRLSLGAATEGPAGGAGGRGPIDLVAVADAAMYVDKRGLSAVPPQRVPGQLV